MDPTRPALAMALRDYRADAQRGLLGIAYALAGDPAAAPAERPRESPGRAAGDSPAHAPGESSDAPRIARELLAPLADALALPDPGGWPAIDALLLDGLSARRLHALGLDVGVHALLEVYRLERAGIGPAAGVLRRRGAHSPAWQRVCDAASARAEAPMVARVAAVLGRDHARLSAAMQRDLSALHGVLADEGVPLLRLAAAHAHVDGAFTTQIPAAVRGAPGWEVHLRIDPTVDGAWLVTVQRVWSGDEPAPRAPVIALTLHAGHGGHAREVHQRIESEDACTMWYEDRSPGPTPRLSARSDEDLAGP